jgi:hypothetical protein
VNGKDSAKTDFDFFIKVRKHRLDIICIPNTILNMTCTIFICRAEDKKWLKNNKIVNDPAIIVLNGDGEVVAQAKSI